MKQRTVYVCQNCGGQSPRWSGKCGECGTWNSLVEEVQERKTTAAARRGGGAANVVTLGSVDASEAPRTPTGIDELDRVLGGGIVGGSVVLVGGDPGIGKSTLMMQMLLRMTRSKSLYVTGEESVKQVALRTGRLTDSVAEQIGICSETNIEIIATTIESYEPSVVIIDSIQTMALAALESGTGSVGQLRECTALLMKIAKKNNIAMFLVGHVTKDGVIAGPKVLEHMVDCVLQFEGERTHAYRILRALKNRFGSTNEIGVFEMRENGLREVPNPSELFLSERRAGTAGCAVVATIEGTRPLLVEVQSLVTASNFGTPQRTTTGFDARRTQMLIAVLEKHVGARLGACDVFVNIAGGVQISEPAADLGVALAMISSFRNQPLDSDTLCIGEIGLAGEVRAVPYIDQRIAEAAKLGFKRILLPAANMKGAISPKGVEVRGVRTLEEATKLV